MNKFYLLLVTLLVTLNIQAGLGTRLLNVPSSEEILEQFDVNRDGDLFDQESIAAAIYLSETVSLALNSRYGLDYSASLFLFMMKYHRYPTSEEIVLFHFSEDKRGIHISQDQLNDFLAIF